MKILLYSPDNGMTRNFMPHLWMFLLQSLTPEGHEVVLIDGNAKSMSRAELVDFCRREDIGLVGIGAMTRMVERAYLVADSLREAGFRVVMGGPHVTECPDEALGRDGGSQHADAVALGEADDYWADIVEDAAAGELKDIYQPKVDEKGHDIKPSLQPYPSIPWETVDLDQFSVIPKFMRPFLARINDGWAKFFIVPIETGRGCPYGCEFCTVTGFFGDSIRFRTNESVVEELLRLKARARREKGKVAVFFIDDNLAINKKRLKGLLRDIVAADAGVPFCAQISANLLSDEELVDLLKAAGARWIFIGMESIDPSNMADVNKTFSRPESYPDVLASLQKRNIYAVTSFIFGMDNDTKGVATRTVDQIEQWPPGLPVFGMLTPFPATPLYKRLDDAGRLRRRKHWLKWTPYLMAHDPLKMTSDEAGMETRTAWVRSYSPERNREVVESLRDKPLSVRLVHLFMRLGFRGIYFPQMGTWAWIKLLAANRAAFMALKGKPADGRKRPSGTLAVGP